MAQRMCAIGLLVLAALLEIGCSNTCLLQRPFNGEKLAVGSAPAPRFEWSTVDPVLHPNRAEYTLTVASDPAFARIRLRKEGLNGSYFQAAPKDPEEIKALWLPGGAEYTWKVEGTVRTPEGEILDTMACANPRQFFLEKRPRVSIDFRLPREKAEPGAVRPEGPAPTIRDARLAIGDEEFKDDASLEMEHGEVRSIVLTFTLVEPAPPGAEGAPPRERQAAVAGVIQVVGANLNTRFGRIIVDNFTPAELASISKGDVGNYTYQLGGADIVKITLGNKIAN